MKPKSLTKRRPFCAKYRVGGVVLILVLILSTITIAFEYPKIKIYGKTEDYTQDYEYNYDLKGLKWILVYPDGYSRVYGGYYYPYQIRLYSSDEDVFVHELAHHYNCVENRECLKHDDGFYRAMKEIWQIREKK